MKRCIIIACCVLGTTGCNADKSPSSSTTEAPSKAPTSPSPTPTPAGSATTPPQGSGSAAMSTGPSCATDFDHGKLADKHMACVECEKHRGMGTMEAECKNAIAKPWK